MANTISSSLAPLIMAEAREHLRNNNQLLACVGANFAAEAAEVGQTINIGTVGDATAGNVTAANVAPSPSDTTVGAKVITLDQHKVTSFKLSDTDWRDNDLTSVARQLIRSRISGLIDTVNTALWGQYYKIGAAAGNTGIGFFASDIDGLADADRVLTDNKCPLHDRKAVISTKDYADALKVDTIQNANTYAGDEVVRRGMIQDVLGFQVMRDQQATTHTIGTITGNPTMGAAAVTVATSLITADSDDTVNINQGDIISVDGATYSAQADLNLANSETGTLTVDRNWETALDGDESLAFASAAPTVFDASTINGIAGDFTGIGVAARIPPTNIMGINTQGEHFVIADPVTSFPILMTFYSQFNQVAVDFQSVYGLQIIEPNKLCRLLTYSS